MAMWRLLASPLRRIEHAANRALRPWCAACQRGRLATSFVEQLRLPRIARQDDAPLRRGPFLAQLPPPVPSPFSFPALSHGDGANQLDMSPFEFPPLLSSWSS